MTESERLIELITQAENEELSLLEFEKKILADYLLANDVIVPPCKVGDTVWVIEREYGEAVDVSGVIFLAKSKGCIIVTAHINNYDIDETIYYHINETQDEYDTNLMVYSDDDCFLTREEAEKALEERREK